MAPHINHNGSTLMGALGEAEDVVSKLSHDIYSGARQSTKGKVEGLNAGEFKLSNGKVVDTNNYDNMKLAILDEVMTNKNQYTNLGAKLKGLNTFRRNLNPEDVMHILFKDLDKIRVNGPRTMANIDEYGYSMNLLDKRSITSAMKDKILSDEVLRLSPEYADNLKIGKEENRFSEILKSYMSASRDSTGRFRLG